MTRNSWSPGRELSATMEISRLRLFLPASSTLMERTCSTSTTPCGTASEREVDGVTVGDNDPASATDDGEDMVQVVARAVSTDVDAGMTITNGTLEGEFLVNNDDDSNADLVYSYDSDDIFIDSTGDEGVEITMDSFITKIKDGGTIEVVAYDADGTSIFRLTAN